MTAFFTSRYGNILSKLKDHFLLVILLVAALIAGVAIFARMISDPRVYILAPEGGAEWIQFADPPQMRSWAPAKFSRVFRKRFTVGTPINYAFLEVRAFRSVTVWLDGQAILPPGGNLDLWKEPRHADLAGRLSPGEHEIVILVTNENAQPAVLAYCKEIGLFTGPGWEASKDRVKWTNASSVEDLPAPSLSRQFPRTDAALFSRLPYYLPLFIIVFSWTFWRHKNETKPVSVLSYAPSAGQVRWFLIAALLVMGINDAIKLPLMYGFDVVGHMDYIQYIAEKHKLPLATEGWMMFHAPLYYIVCAPFYAIFSKLFALETVSRLLRVISIIGGVLLVELSYRAQKYVFPDRGDLQIIGTIIGGLMPMKLYSSLVIGNEVFAGCFAAIVTVMCFSLIRSGQPGRRWFLPVLGLMLGLAILSKMTAVMLAPPVMLPLIFVLFAGDNRVKKVIFGIATVFVLAFAISAWFYIRNKLLLGTYNIGDWSQTVYLEYWQDPSYRTSGQLYKFGQALVWPVFSGAHGLWDAIYSTFWLDGYLSSADRYEIRPPWNYGFMLSGALLAILPSLAIIIGILKTIRRPVLSARDGTLFAALVVTIYFAGFVFHFLRAPFYSGAKSTYLVGLTPCFAVLAASGMDLLIRHPIARALTYSLLACWAASAYLAYFVL